MVVVVLRCDFCFSSLWLFLFSVAVFVFVFVVVFGRVCVFVFVFVNELELASRTPPTFWSISFITNTCDEHSYLVAKLSER